MKKIAITLFATGSAGFLIGGAGLDGSAFTASVILTVVSFAVAAVGYRLWAESERAYEEARRKRKEEEIEAAKQINARAKEATFQVWLTACKLDVPL